MASDETSEFMSDFGQKVDLCQRIRDVTTNYPEGALLKEMVQNADDAGARVFRVMLDYRSHGTSSLVAPKTGAFQGPSLNTYNDAVFTDTDFESIQHIGGSKKTEATARTKTGRFGVGFNSSYHVTDLPCFVSRRYLVMLDPHCAHLPNVSSSEPGKMINFLHPGMREKYADQLAPFRVFGCTMDAELNATIFRLALRTDEQAATSRISKRACSPAAARVLVDEFAAALPEVALFLTHIHTLEVYTWEAADAQPRLLRGLVVSDHATGAAPDRQRLHALVRSAMHDLRGVGIVEDTTRLAMRPSTPGAAADSSLWVVAQSMGGGKPREMSIDKDVADYGLQPVPWGGVSALITARHVADNSEGGLAVHGRPYCLLPLPSSTGLPVHVNGFFELSSNRRDIWYGTDMVGAGKLRSDWNCALIEDVIAPSYKRLLLEVKQELLSSGRFYELWPQQRPAEPWGRLVDTLYRSILEQPLLHTAARGGEWVSPMQAVFSAPMAEGDAAAGAMHGALLRSGMPLVHVPASVVSLLQSAARSAGVALQTADAPTVRKWLLGAEPRQSGLSREEGLALLAHCLSDMIDGSVDVGVLHGLRLLPLASGSFGELQLADAPSLLLCEASERKLFRHQPALLVAVDLDGPLGQLLGRVAASGRTNVSRFSAALVARLLPAMLPSGWRGAEVVALRAVSATAPVADGTHGAAVEEWPPADGDGEPTMEWLLALWEYLGHSHAQAPLAPLAGWPLLPADGGVAYAIPKGGLQASRMLDLEGCPAELSRCLRGAGCLALHGSVSHAHPQLRQCAPTVTACSVLRALQVAATSAAVGSFDRSIGGLFVSVGLSERRALRAMLAERRHVEQRELSGADHGRLLGVLRELPIYEVHASSLPMAHSAAEGEPVERCAEESEATGFGCVALDLEIHRLAPEGIQMSLLDERFVRCVVTGESGLVLFAGIPQIGRSRFYREHVFPRLGELQASERDRAMVGALYELHALSAEDAGFVDALRELAFVPVARGGLRRASELFHPRVGEAAELLDGAEVYPSGLFAEADALSVLERLGMRALVTRSAVLQSARAIETLAANGDASAARRRAGVLLRHIDVHAPTLIVDVKPPAPKPGASTGSAIGGASWLGGLFSSQKRPSAADEEATQPAVDTSAHDMGWQAFTTELQMLAWLPVHVAPPEPYLPWDTALCSSPVAASREVRPREEQWLVSASCRLLEGEVRSVSLRQLLGWHTPPNLFVLASQLGTLARTASASDDAAAFKRTMAVAVPTLYQALEAALQPPSGGGRHAGEASADDIDASAAVLGALSEQMVIWSGDTFVKPANTALRSPLNLAPYLHTVPAGLHCFESLLRKLGVRPHIEAGQYLELLGMLASRANEAPLEAEPLQLVLAIVQQLASPQHQPLPPQQVYLPDRSGILVPSHQLMYDDAPWLADGSLAHGVGAASAAPSVRSSRKVHPDVAHEVAQRLGASSLRRQLIARNADTLSLGLEDVEAFGQHESLTSRLHNILGLYADGIGILHELIQNADDAGATRVAFLLDERTHGHSSLLSPAMKSWQGPALYCFNDAQFSPNDFRNICSIGSNQKLANTAAIGRFGLGFNAVYHFTDVPSFVSGEHIVFFDPHAESLPGATPANPGLKIRFAGTGYLGQFPDQFQPYCHFGCDMNSAFAGTLFRFPLRTAEAAATSKLRQEAYSLSAVRALLETMHSRAAETLLFLKGVNSVEVLVHSAHAAEPHLVFRAQREASSCAGVVGSGGGAAGAAAPARPILDFIKGSGGLSKGAFYQRLQASDARLLPRENARLRLTITSARFESAVAPASAAIGMLAEFPAAAEGAEAEAAAGPDGIAMAREGSRWLEMARDGPDGIEMARAPAIAAALPPPPPPPAAPSRLVEAIRSEEWLVCSTLGRNAPRIVEMCLTREGRQLKLMPWGGAAARIDSRSAHADASSPDAPATTKRTLTGQAFCFLPLPAETGLPVHSNGYFELSANRRDIWYGTDMVGDGKLRSDWNCALIEDVIAPSYAQLLLEARGATMNFASYYELWPQQRPAEPWGRLVDTLYRSILEQPLLHTAARGGEWVSPMQAVFSAPTAEGDAAAGAMHGALLRSGMPLVHVPASVVSLLQSAARSAGVALQTADAPTVRKWLLGAEARQSGLSREEGLALLAHCLSDMTERAADVGVLHGLRLLPLVSGGWGRLVCVENFLMQQVRLHGLAARPDLNGRTGVVVSFDASVGRYQVQVDGTDEGFKVLPDKMVLLGAPSGAAAASASSSSSDMLVLCAASEQSLLKHKPGLLLAVDPDEPLGESLTRLARTSRTNVVRFCASVVARLLPALLPASWRSMESMPITPATGEETGPTLEWLLALWEYLGHSHAQAPLAPLAGWPLLPTDGGVAYALPEGGLQASRMLDLEGCPAELSRCLRGAGCLALHGSVSHAHPQLQQYVHRVSACSVLRALVAASTSLHGSSGGGGSDRLGPHLAGRLEVCFATVGLAERRALRTMLAGHRHSEEAELRYDTSLLPALRALPIFEVHTAPSVDTLAAVSSSGRSSETSSERAAITNEEGEATFTALDLEVHRLAPEGIQMSLLDERFVRCVVTGESGLVLFAGIPQIGRSRFYREHVFPRLGELQASERDRAMVGALYELHALSAEDAGFVDALRELAFVPVARGGLRRASELFHPRVGEAAELLDGAEVYPSGLFAEADALSVLERLGMRALVTRSAVLQSARAIETLSRLDTGDEGDVARRRGFKLLAFINTHLERLPVDVDEFQPLLDDLEFTRALAKTAWMPVLRTAAHPQLPWAARQSAVAAPEALRPLKDMWLVSHCLGVLEGELTCEPLVCAFGWAAPPRAPIVCAQLVQLAKIYSAATVSELMLWNELCEPAYAQLTALASTPEFAPVETMLRSRPCLWIDRDVGFLSPEHVAFSESTVASRYLMTSDETSDCL
jgi:hypothetical protein